MEWAARLQPMCYRPILKTEPRRTSLTNENTDLVIDCDLMHRDLLAWTNRQKGPIMVKCRFCHLHDDDFRRVPSVVLYLATP